MKMRYLATSMLAVLVTSPLSVIAHDSKPLAAAPAAISAEAAQPAVAVVERFGKALQAADFKTIGDLLAPDVLILESGGAEHSREEYLEHHAISDAAFLQGAHVQVMQRAAHLDGTVAWVGTESELHTSRDGKSLVLLSTETMILKKEGSEWRITHIHWSSRPKK